MLKFVLFFVFLFFIALLLMGFTAVRTIFHVLFGGSRKNSGNRPHSDSGQKNRQSSSHPSYSQKKQEKIFPSNEGEYVDFEEIKETNK